jgi:hypothetical protein
MQNISFALLAMAFAGAAVTAHIWSGPQGAAPAKEGVQTSDEPHHHEIVDNLRLKAFEVEVPAHEATLLHRHDKDYVYIVLGDADITNAVVGQQEVKAHLLDSDVNFVEGPISHVATDVGDTPFRNITIELKRKQGELKKYYPSANAALADTAKAVEPDGSKIILETDEVRVETVKVAPGQVWAAPKSSHPRLFVLIDNMKDLPGPKEKKAPTFPEGMLVWVQGGKKWSMPNYTKADLKLVWLDFKN